MSPEDYEGVIRDGSPYWEAVEAIEEVLPRSSFLPEEFGGDGMSGKEFQVVTEELGWASSGIAMGFI